MESNTENWGPKLWNELRTLDQHEVCARCNVEYDADGYYVFHSLNSTVKMYIEEERFESSDSTLAQNTDFHLLAVSYLLYAQNKTPTGRWISEKDLLGGSTFFRGPHALPAAPLERLYSSDAEGFRKKAENLGATASEFGDVSMVFPALPRMDLVIVLWTADDEFPARVTFMLDSSIEGQLPLDVIFAMAQTVVAKMAE